MSILNKIFGKKHTDDEVSKDTKQNNEEVIYMEDTTRPIMPTPAVTTTTIRRNNTPPPKQSLNILSMNAYNTGDGMIDTIIIRYDKPQILSKIKAEVEEHAVKSASSFINRFIDVDIFVNISLSPEFVNPDRYRGQKWLRVVYELTEDNRSLSAVRRFPQCIVITLDTINRFDKKQLTLNKLLGGI